jgi:hypothetical protein
MSPGKWFWLAAVAGSSLALVAGIAAVDVPRWVRRGRRATFLFALWIVTEDRRSLAFVAGFMCGASFPLLIYLLG